MTGHWVGKWSCTGFYGEKFREGEKNSTMAVTQVGNTFGADLDGGFLCNGEVIPDFKKPDEKGEAVLVSCGTDNLPLNTPSEVIRARVKTRPGSFKASFKGLSIYTEPGDVETCKYSYKRLDQLDPGVGPCP